MPDEGCIPRSTRKKVRSMLPRDVVKLAFQFQETSQVPFTFGVSREQAAALTEHYGDPEWPTRVPAYLSGVAGVDNFMSYAGFAELPDGCVRDIFGCVWKMGSTHHLVQPALKELSLNGHHLPDVKAYFDTHVRPRWPEELKHGTDRFRLITHSFGLFERFWSLTGFEEGCMALVESPAFCEQAIEMIADWMLESIDQMLGAPVDAIMLTDDYADQRGMIFGLDRFRRFFKPHWTRIFGRIRKAGVYSILHVCGNAEPALPDLIECGLDCLESLQPEAMDVYQLKRDYGKDLRFWGGLGCQRVLPFGTPGEVRSEVRRLKQEMARGGGYILAGAKGIGEEVPPANVIAYLEEALQPREG